MITSALISQLRRQYDDKPKSTRVARAGDGATTLFNLGKFPVIEGSYSIYKGTSAQTEGSNYTLDKDTGDLNYSIAPAASIEAIADYKYANFRDQNWVEAINHGIESLNSRGFFKQVVRNTAIMRLSANVRVYNGPSACIDLYEVLESDDYTVSGGFRRLGVNWSYQQDANKLVLGNKPTVANRLAISYLRNLKTYTAISATLDVLDDWLELVKVKAGAYYFRHMAAKKATEGNANIDEGHFSFTSLRTMANDLEADFERLAARKKPTRPTKEFQYHLGGGGVA